MNSDNIIILFISYLIGSIPFGLILAKKFVNQDLRIIGSGNVGATNAYRACGKVIGATTLLLDVLKTVMAVSVARCFGSDDVLAALFVMIGHIFPVWTKFRGGKGVANFIGILAMFYLNILPIFLMIWLGVFVVSRIASLSSIIAVMATLIAIFYQSDELNRVVYLFLTISVVIIVRHHNNIKNILNGTEYKFDQ